MSPQLNEMLKGLCCNNGWSYGIIWRASGKNSMLMTPEDVYLEEFFAGVVQQLLQQVQMLGEGAIGQAAFTGKHRWIFSDTYCGEWNPTGSAYNQEVFQEKSQLNIQFATGIKTIAVIPVSQNGVVQFASRHKILERLDFVNHIRCMFRQLENINGNFLGNTSMASNAEVYDNQIRVVASGTSCSNDWYANTVNGNNFKDLMEPSQSPMMLPHPPPFNVGLQTESMNSMASSFSFHLDREFQTGSTGTEVLSSLPNMQSQEVFAQMSSSPANKSSSGDPSMNTWNNEFSTLTPYEQQMLSVNNEQQYPNTFASSRRDLSCSGTSQNLQGVSSHGFYNSNGVPVNNITGSAHNFVTPQPLDTCNRLAFPMNDNRQQALGVASSSLGDDVFNGVPVNNVTGSAHNFVTAQPLDACNGLAFPMNENRQPALGVASTSSGFPGGAFNGVPNNITGSAHDFITAQPLDTGNTLAFPTNDNQQQALGVALSSAGFAGDDVFRGVPLNNATGSAHNSVTDINMVRDMVCDGNVNSSAPMLLPSDSDLFGDLDFALNPNPGAESWDDILLPVGSGSHSNLSNGTSECVSELDVGSMPVPQKDLFAEFGLEELLDGLDRNVNCGNIPSSENQLSTPIVRTGTASADGSQLQFLDLSFFTGNMNGLVPEPSQNSMQNNHKESPPKSQVGSWIDDSYSINAESAVTTQPMKSDERAKSTKKRARPGESSRPRPKDRQLIQERVKELREIIPNTAKCSIDVLLDRAVKHMLFLQSVANYSDKLKQADDPKMLGSRNGLVIKDSDSTGSGSTWAFEIGGHSMVCPIIVDELNPSGQMLVEMLCEDRGFFLEIADTIRGFGLTILKGVMEVRAEKIWARFIVEANGSITRLEIFLALAQLLQQTSDVVSFNNQLTKAVKTGAPSSSNS